MNLGIIISGNLTGFSRFYTSPDANDIYNNAKFDFDYRNFVTFLESGDKLYAVSFSPKVVAVSLVTRILDSFRRPGLLVVSVLIPRNQLVGSRMNLSDKAAIYRLLNEVNDKFYEKNFINGILNQNPAVLAQDYYSDILSGFTYVNDSRQRPVGSMIDIAAFNKRFGYVKASENVIPQYLSSIFRKSYDGYHHVFFSDKAPQNIDEPVEEVVTYHVRVANENRPIPGEMRLTDRIPNVQPKRGEKDLPNKNFTYGQILNGEAGASIEGYIEGDDTFVIKYNFPSEEKTVSFKFIDGSEEVAFEKVHPIIVKTDGGRYPLSSEKWTFIGSEIYEVKGIESGNREYTVDPSTRIELSRIQNGDTVRVYVQHGWIWNFSMTDDRGRNLINRPVDITLTNKITKEVKSFPKIRGRISELLSGKAEDWDMLVEAEGFEPLSISASVLGNPNYPIQLKPRRTVPAEGGEFRKPLKSDSSKDSSAITTSGKPNSRDTRVSGGENDIAKETERLRKEELFRKYIIGGVAVVATIAVAVGLYFLMTKWILKPKEDVVHPSEDETELGSGEQNVPTEISTTLVFVDNDGKPIEESLFKVLSYKVEPKALLTDDQGAHTIKLTYDKTTDPKLKVDVYLKGYEAGGTVVCFYTYNFPIDSLTQERKIKLLVKNDELKSYISLIDNQTVPHIDRLITDLNRRGLTSYAALLLSKLPPNTTPPSPGTQQQVASEQATPVVEAVADPVSESTKEGQEKIRSSLDATTLDVSQLNVSNPTEAEKARITTLRSILHGLAIGRCPMTTNNLSAAQAAIVNELQARKAEIEGLSDENKKRAALEVFTLGLKQGDKNGKISLNTARNAITNTNKILLK